MYQKYTDFGRQKGIVTLTPNTVDALTNEEQVKKIQALERGAAESTRLIENLWVQNCGLVKTIVHNVTGLNAGEPGFDDMEQQSFFGFHAAIYTYDPAADIKFSTYVAKRIKWEICRYYERNGYTIRVPAFMKRRFRECLKKQQQLENTLSRKVSIEAALRELGLSDSIIAGTMAAFHRMKTTSIEAGIECSGEDLLPLQCRASLVGSRHNHHKYAFYITFQNIPGGLSLRRRVSGSIQAFRGFT